MAQVRNDELDLLIELASAQKTFKQIRKDAARKTWTATFQEKVKRFYGPQWKGNEQAKAAALRWLNRCEQAMG